MTRPPSSRSVETIARQLGVPVEFVEELCEAGIVEPDPPPHSERIIERVRVSWTLVHELGVNLAGVEVALHLLSIIERDRRTIRGRQ